MNPRSAKDDDLFSEQGEEFQSQFSVLESCINGDLFFDNESSDEEEECDEDDHYEEQKPMSKPAVPVLISLNKMCLQQKTLRNSKLDTVIAACNAFRACEL